MLLNWLLGSFHHPNSSTAAVSLPQHSSTSSTCISNPILESSTDWHAFTMPNDLPADLAAKSCRLSSDHRESALASTLTPLGKHSDCVTSATPQLHAPSRRPQAPCHSLSPRSRQTLLVLVLVLLVSLSVFRFDSSPFRKPLLHLHSKHHAHDLVMNKLLRFVALVAHSSAAAIGRQATVTPSIVVPSAAPTDASPVVDRSFPGFAFEIASVVQYATGTSR